MGTEFVELPESALVNTWDRSRRLFEFAADLRANPGRWAKYPFSMTATSAQARASQIRCGKMVPAFREGQFQATVRDGALYVRAVA